MYRSEGLILASASPRRRELLATIGLECAVAPAEIDETVLPGEEPVPHVLRLSAAKAEAIGILSDPAGRWVVGSDTVVVCDGIILGKPTDSADAVRMLQMLSGRTHEVVTGYALHDRLTGRTDTGSITTEVRFRPLTTQEIERYVATGEPLDKAGAYGIQGIGAVLVESINGSYPAVVGLPITALTKLLIERGAIHLSSRSGDGTVYTQGGTPT